MGTPSDVGALWQQVAWLLILPIPIASISWTVTHEEIFRELRDYCTDRSEACRSLFKRKFFYMVTCEYCFSHWVTLAFVAVTGFRLLLDDWRGFVIGYFARDGGRQPVHEPVRSAARRHQGRERAD